MVESLGYNLRIFGVNLEVPEEVYCGNKSLVANFSVPASVLNKRHNNICYQIVRESQASGTSRVGWIPGEYNIAD